MPNLLVSALNAGELSPYMDARSDVEKYRSGCRTLENMVVLPYGGVYRRAGTEYVGNAKNDDRQCRLIGFNFSVTTRFVLEFGHEYIRVWGNNGPVLSGGSPLEIASPYQEGELRELQYVQVNDIMYLAHANHAPRKLSRVTDTNWTLAAVKWKYPPLLDQNTTKATLEASASSGSAVTITARDKDSLLADDTFLAGHVGSQWAVQWPRSSGEINTTISGNKITDETLDLQGSWTLTTVGTWLGKIRLLRIPRQKMDEGGGSDATALARSGTTATATLVGHGYKTGDEIFIPSTVASPFAGTYTITRVNEDTYTFTVANSGSSSVASAAVQNLTQMEVVREFTSLTTARNFTATGNEGERVGLKIRITDYVSNTNARVFLESTDFNSGGTFTVDAIGTNGQSATVTVDKWLGKTITATTQWSEAAFSGVRGYPRAVAIHEQRLCFGGTSHQPNTVWCSKTDDFENFQLGAAADDAIALSVASGEGNRIAWMFSQKRLMLGTSGDEWTIGGADTGQPFSSINLQAQKQSSFGSKIMRAILLNDVLLFVQRRGRKVRELTYNFERDGWVAPDLTVLSEHITEGEIVELAFQQQPDAILWAVRGDGQLIGMSYERDQNVVAWHRHTTDGDFESVATVYGLAGADDEVWFVVKRTINGQTKRYIERFKPDARVKFESAAKADWWYLDCARRYSGSATAAIGNLTHLQGKTVGVLADGAAQADRVVNNGQIVLDRPFAKVLAGLPYTSTILPMKFDFDLQDGSTRGRTKRINRAEVSLYKSLGGEFSTDGNEWLWIYPRDFDDPMDASPPTFSGDAEVVVAGNYSDASDLYLRQTLPYPLTVRALVVKLDSFGD
jgi:hypothetical protein